MARVTVCLAVYNGAESMGKALEAVYAQTYKDFEVLVLDDGSTDDSAQIASKFDCRVLTVPNGGLGAARKRMVEEATGELIAFVDHDDFWIPEKLERQIDILDRTGADLAHSDGWYVYEDGREVARDLNFPPSARSFDHILPSNLVIASTALFRREEMLAAGNFVADTVRCSDWYGWLVLAPGRKFVHVPDKQVRYSVLSTSLANAGLKFHEAQHYLLTKKILPMRHEMFRDLPPGIAAKYTSMLVQRSGIALSGMARSLDKQGDRKAAREMAWKAVKTAPSVPKVWARAARYLVR